MIPQRPIFLLAVATALIVAPDGCAGDPDPGDATAEWSHEVSTRGDTTFVRTLGGSQWGDTMTLEPDLVIGDFDGEDAYVFVHVTAVDHDTEGRIWLRDRQAGEVRVIRPDGNLLRVVGSRGDGPGECQEPDHLRVTSSGEIVVRDQRGARFVVLSTEGRFLRTWGLSGTFSMSQPFYLDDQDRIWNPDLRRGTDMDHDDREVLVQIDVATGEPLDTVPRPSTGLEAAFVEVRIETGDSRMVSRSNVPFYPGDRYADS